MQEQVAVKVEVPRLLQETSLSLFDLTDEQYYNLHEILSKIEDYSSRADADEDFDGDQLAEIIGLQVSLDVYKGMLGVPEMSNEDFIKFIGHEDKDDEEGATFDVYDLDPEEISKLFDIADRLTKYSDRIDQDDDISGEELAEIVGLQVALDVYKTLFGVDYLDNAQFFNYIDYDHDHTGSDSTYSLWDLPREELDSLYSISERLSNYTESIEDGSDISGQELAEIVGLQVALDVYKSLLGVDHLNNAEFYNFTGFEWKGNNTDTDKSYSLSELPDEERDNLLDIADRLYSLAQKVDSEEDISGEELAELVGLQVAFDVYKSLLGVDYMSNTDFYWHIGYIRDEWIDDIIEPEYYDLSDLPIEEIESIYDISARLFNYTESIEDGDDISGQELAEIVGLQVALDVYKSLLGVDYMSNTEFYNFTGFE